MLDEIGRPRTSRPGLMPAIANEVKGHGLRPPRLQGEGPARHRAARVRRKHLRETGRPKYDVAVELEKRCADILGPEGIYPNVNFYSGIVYQALGIPRDLFTPIFAIARVAGWLAHWLEQLEEQPHLPAGADLRRQAGRGVRAAGERGRDTFASMPRSHRVFAATRTVFSTTFRSPMFKMRCVQS